MIIESGSTVVINRPVYEDLYLAGGTLVVNAPVHGDLVVAGGTVNLNDTIDKDILVLGGRVTLGGYAGGKVRCVSGDLRIMRSVKSDVALAGGTLTIEKGCVIGGGLLATGGELIIYGTVNGNIRSGAGRTRLFGSVGGDLDCRGGSIEIDGAVAGSSILAAAQTLDIGTNASFGGPVRYWSNSSVDFGSSLKNGGPVRDESLAIQRTHWYFLGSMTLWGLLAWLGAGLVEIIVLQYLFGGFLRKAGQRFSKDALRSLGAGFLFVVAVPVLIGLCFITVVGIPLALGLLFGYIILWLFASGLIALVLANRLNSGQSEAWKFWRMVWTAFAIFFVLKMAFGIPVLGWILFPVLACIVYGAILMDVRWVRRGNHAGL